MERRGQDVLVILSEAKDHLATLDPRKKILRFAQDDTQGPAPGLEKMNATEMEILVNGNAQLLEPGASVAGLITVLGLDIHRVAVEVNRELVRRASFADRTIEPGDRVEIVEFVGGG